METLGFALTTNVVSTFIGKQILGQAISDASGSIYGSMTSIFRYSSKNLILNQSKKIQLYVYKNKLNKYESFVLSKGKPSKGKSIHVRVLSKKINKSNLLKNKEIKKNISILSKYKSYILVVINNEMIKAEKKSETDLTLRYYGLGAQIIKDLNIKNMILISRSRKKIIGLEGFGLKIKKQIIIK